MTRYPLLIVALLLTGCATSTTSGRFDPVTQTFEFETKELTFWNAELKKKKNMDFSITTDADGNVTITGKGNGESESVSQGVDLGDITDLLGAVGRIARPVSVP